MYNVITPRLGQLAGLIVIASMVTIELQGCVGSGLNLLLYAQIYASQKLW